MSTFKQQFEARVARIAEEFNVTFRYAVDPQDVLEGRIGGPEAFLNRLILPIWDADSTKNLRSQAHAAANHAVWQALMSEFLLQSDVEAAHRGSMVVFPGKGEYSGLIRQIVCDAFAVRLAEERFVHPDDGTLYHSHQGSREASLRRALLATAHIGAKSNLQKKGFGLMMRVRLIVELQGYDSIFSAGGKMLQNELEVAGTKRLVSKAYSLFMFVREYLSPAQLVEESGIQAVPRRLSVVGG